MSDPGPQTLRGELKEALGELNTEATRKGVDVDELVATVRDATEYSEADVRDELGALLRAGEVYPPTPGRVKRTP